MRPLVLTIRCHLHNAPPRQSTSHTTSISPNVSDQDILTDDEKSRIDRLPFFLRSSKSNDTGSITATTATTIRKPTSKFKSLTHVQQEYLARKIASIRSVFGPDPEYNSHIGYTLQHNQPTPFQAHSKRKNRLAVTNLSTKIWCELRTAYDIYSGEERMPTKSTLYGTKFHKSLEEQLHPANQDMAAFIASQGVTQDKHELLAMSWWNTIQKFIDLFTSAGECREVLCHGYLREQDAWFIQDPSLYKDPTSLVLVSGIVDHLFWARSSELSRGDPDYFNSEGCGKNVGNFDVFSDVFTSQKSMSDIAKLIEDLKTALNQGGKDWEILVGDVKTRSSFTTPSYQSVIEATKLQIMYYRLFLQLLGGDTKHAYEKLLLNAKIRGVDVDAPINPILIVALMISAPHVIKDMRRLRDGQRIRMTEFDEFYASNVPSPRVPYDTSYLSSTINVTSVQHTFKEFFQPWKIPVTLKYFAARLAQFYGLVGSRLSKKLLVEYYCDGRNFKNVPFDYDEDVLRLATRDSSLFWFGKRGIEPIRPSLKNLLTYCKFCEYEDVCAWRMKGAERCKQLGADLANIYQDSGP